MNSDGHISLLLLKTIRGDEVARAGFGPNQPRDSGNPSCLGSGTDVGQSRTPEPGHTQTVLLEPVRHLNVNLLILSWKTPRCRTR